MAHKMGQTDKGSCSKCDFSSERDQKLDTHIVIKHFKVNFAWAQHTDKYECNECADYFNEREASIKHVKKRGNVNLTFSSLFSFKYMTGIRRLAYHDNNSGLIN